MADFTIKAHDLLPSIQATLFTGGVVIDLTGATSVKFIMTSLAMTTPKVAATATIVSPATAGTVRYDWAGTDTDTPGDYRGEFQITWTAGSKKQTVPTDTYVAITVRADADNA